MQVLAATALSFAASYLIQWLFPVKMSGQKSDNGLSLPSIAEGTRIPVLLGSRRLSGNIIWYGQLKKKKQKQKAGKGGSSAAYSTYTYSLSFAIALAATNGSAFELKKIYRNDTELDLALYPNIRFYGGHANQTLDPLLAAAMEYPTPYRNICYAVFEDFDLGTSPSIPALSFIIAAGYNSETWTGRSKPLTASEPDTSHDAVISSGLTRKGFERYTYRNSALEYQTDGSNIELVEVVFVDDIIPNDDLFQSVGYGANASFFYSSFKQIRSYVVPVDKFVPGAADYDEVAIAVGNVYALQELGGLERWVFSGTFVFGCAAVVAEYRAFRALQYGVYRTSPADYKTGGNDIKYIGGVYDFYLYFEAGLYYQEGDGYYMPPRTDYLGRDWQRYDEILTRYEISIPEYSRFEDHLEIQVAVAKHTWSWFDTPDAFPEFPDVDPNLLPVEKYLRRIEYYRLPDNSIVPPTHHTRTISIYVASDIPKHNTPPTVAAELIFGGNGLVLGRKKELDDDAFNVEGISSLYGYILGQVQELPYSSDGIEIYTISPLYNDEITVIDAIDELSRYFPFFIRLEFNDVTTTFRFMSLALNGSSVINNYYYGAPLDLTKIIVMDSDVSIKRRTVSQTKNKVRVNYSDAAKKFDRATESASDENDIESTGDRDVQMEMLACTSGNYAQWLADFYLQKNMERPFEISIQSGLKYFRDFQIGNLVTLVHPASELTIKAIVLETELSDTYKLSVKLQQVSGYIETGMASVKGSGSVAAVQRSARSIDTAFLLELPKLVTGGKCGYVLAVAPMQSDTEWAGCGIYESSDGSTYSYVEQTEIEAVYGDVINVLGDRIVVRLTSDATLNSYASEEAFLLSGFDNLAYMPDSGMFLRIGSAMQVGSRVWEITMLIADVMGCPVLNGFQHIPAGQIVFLSSTMFFREKPATLANNRYYYKFPSFSTSGTMQDLSDCTAFSDTFDAYGDMPLPVDNISVNGMGEAKLFTAGDLTVTWVTRNRSRLNAYIDDADFISFSVSVLVDGEVKRTTTTADASYIYSASDWAADGAPAELTFSIVKNCAVGRSAAATKVIEVIS